MCKRKIKLLITYIVEYLPFFLTVMKVMVKFIISYITAAKFTKLIYRLSLKGKKIEPLHHQYIICLLFASWQRISITNSKINKINI